MGNLQCTTIFNINFLWSLLTLNTICRWLTVPKTVCSLYFLISSSQNSLYRWENWGSKRAKVAWPRLHKQEAAELGFEPWSEYSQIILGSIMELFILYIVLVMYQKYLMSEVKAQIDINWLQYCLRGDYLLIDWLMCKNM